MTRGRLISVLLGVLLLALIAWIGSNTYWADTQVPMPLKGEAAVNPFYAAQHLAEALGARTSWDRVLTTPQTDAVIVLSAWHWDLSASRRDTLERWVESGGRLVVDRSLSGNQDEFARWSGVARVFHERDDAEEDEAAEEEQDAEAEDDAADSSEDTDLTLAKGLAEPECHTLQQERDGKLSTDPNAPRYWLCDFTSWSVLVTGKKTSWALRDEAGIQAVRVGVGRGTVTVINATPFRQRNLFDGDHAWLFVAATDLRHGDEVHFLSEDEHPSLLTLLWQYGSPVVVLALVLIAALLWRGGVRFGPLVAPTPTSRRSLAEQIRGTGAFALQHGGGDSLHAACVRALEEAAERRVPGFARLSAKERAGTIARLTGFDQNSLAAAIYHPALRRAAELRSTIALLEAARRQTLAERGKRTTS